MPQYLNILLIQKVVLFLFIFMIFIAISEGNLIKKIIFLNVSQSCLILLFILRGFNFSIIEKKFSPFYDKITNPSEALAIVDPVPQALMLTAIVVGFSISTICLSLIVRLKKSFGTIEENQIEESILKKISDK